MGLSPYPDTQRVEAKMQRSQVVVLAIATMAITAPTGCSYPPANTVVSPVDVYEITTQSCTEESRNETDAAKPAKASLRGLEILAPGHYVFKPLSYCAAAGMRIAMVSPHQRRLQGRFHGDCRGGRRPTGPFFEQSLGYFRGGERLDFKLMTDHYRMGKVVQRASASGACRITDASDHVRILYRFDCDDGFRMGDRDDLSFEIYRKRRGVKVSVSSAPSPRRVRSRHRVQDLANPFR
jgi:hypothetical protein